MSTSEIVQKNNLALCLNCIPTESDPVFTYFVIDPEEEVFHTSFSDLCKQNAIFLDQ